MSDNTPGSAEFEELPEDEVMAEDSVDAEAADVSRDALIDDEAELDLQLDEPVAAVAQSGVRRKTAQAPVRRKDLSPAADDEVIAELEAGLPADGTTGTARKTAKAPVKKDRATKKRSESTHVEADPYATANPAVFVKQSADELKKVVWPTWPQLVAYFLSVLVFVLFFIAFVGLLDLFFGWGLLKLFGDS